MGLLGQQQPQNKMQALLQNPALYAGLGLLSQGGQAGGAIQGLQVHNQMQNQQQQLALTKQQIEQREKDRQLRMQMLQQQLAASQQRMNAPTANMRDFEHRQSLDPEQQAQYDAQFARSQNTPATIQEFNMLEKMTPEQRELWFQNKRAMQTEDVGGVAHRLDPLTQQLAPLTTVDEVAGNEAQRAQERAQAAKVGAAVGDAQVSLAGSGIDLEANRAFLDELRNHPGKSSAVGVFARFDPSNYGEAAADFKQKLQTAEGRAFATAYETLKGGGTITEVETNMATKALGNLDTAQSEEQFDQALDQLELAFERGHRKLEAKARLGGDTGANPGTAEPDAAPRPGSVVDGWTFLGGDPADPNNWQQK